MDAIAEAKAKAAEMSKEELVAELRKLNVNFDARVTRASLADDYVQAIQLDIATRQVTEKAAKEAKEQGEKVIKCRFINILDPRTDISFTFNGKKYHLMDGHEYELPISVIEHLNGKDGACMYPQTEPIIDPATGDQKGSQKVLRNRFTATILDLSAVG